MVFRNFLNSYGASNVTFFNIELFLALLSFYFLVISLHFENSLKAKNSFFFIQLHFLNSLFQIPSVWFKDT